MKKKNSVNVKSKAEKFRDEKKKTKAMKKLTMWGIGIVVVIVFLGLIVNFGGDSTPDVPAEDLVYGDDVIEMSYFHWTRCSHCIVQNEYNQKLLVRFPNLRITEYEITEPTTSDKYKELANITEGLDPESFPGTPLTIIGEEFNVGYGTEDTTGVKLVEMIEKVQAEIDKNWDASTMKRTVSLGGND